jgi:hypothetical protein
MAGLLVLALEARHIHSNFLGRLGCVAIAAVAIVLAVLFEQ